MQWWFGALMQNEVNEGEEKIWVGISIVEVLKVGI